MQKKVIYQSTISIFLCYLLSGCSTYGENGELIRHHFGYVKVITPVVYGENQAIRVLNIKTTGLWVDIDKRITTQHTGSGFGIGFRSDHREMIPLDCRWIVHVNGKNEIDYFLSSVEKLDIPREGLCVIDAGS
ncbi:MAG: hypothetical protein AB2809_06625 [Candidatus Thiodiazotropha sp.]